MDINIYKRLLILCYSSANQILGQLTDSKRKDDTRYRFYEMYSCTIGAYLIVQLLMDKNDDLEGLLNNADIKLNSDAIKQLHYYHEIETRSAFFIASVVYFETGIRSLGKALNVAESNNTNAYIENVITASKVEADYKALIKIIFYARNTMHNGGIHRKPDAPLEYKGKKFLFEKDSGIRIANSDMEFLISEFMLLWKDLSLSDMVREITFIKHPYVEEYEVQQAKKLIVSEIL
jgi:hypothetical protein